MAAADAVAEMQALHEKASSGTVKGLLAGYLEELKVEAAAAEAAAAPAAAAAAPAAEAPSPAVTPPTVSPATGHLDPVTGRRASGPRKGPMVLQLDKLGDGMIDKMQEFLADDKVQFALVQIPVGSGSFVRQKMLTITWVGPSVPPMKRAKHVQKKGEVDKVFGHTHANLTMDTKKECSIEFCLSELRGVFVTDSGKFSAAAMKAEIEALIEKARRADLGMQRPGRKTAKDMGVKEDKVLEELRKNRGKFNWCLLEPSPGKLKLFNAGSASIDEMHDNLEEDRVLYGLVRLAFGKGEWRRTKWICLTFIGQSMGNIERGKQLAFRGEMEKRLLPHSVTIEVQGKEEATISCILDRVKKSIVSDDLGHDEVTEENFRAALAEETEETAKEFGAEEPAGGQSEEVTNAVRLLHAQGAPHWGLFSIE
eukprot:TRINITY_DN40179_c0_g1_i1.p1 TRINITY_DN40179_c0_g1~~TRINITY_DN40179_c0_g1_i1.p1  ORF type:complete len:454 (+),score=160.87 TRINITY_DN40179_c0_g1_i1:93-1364(+)